MKNHIAPLMLLMTCSLLASGCGGGSGADGLSSEDPGANGLNSEVSGTDGSSSEGSGTDGPGSEGSGTDALISGNGNSNTAIDNDIPAIDNEIPIDPLVSNDAVESCLLYTSPSPRDGLLSRMPSSA